MTEEYKFTKSGDGINITIPVMVFEGSTKVQSRVVLYLEETEVARIAEMLDLPHPVIVTTDPAANRANRCKNSHRLISENVIHWPNGTEDCRVCYMEWQKKRDQKAAAK